MNRREDCRTNQADTGCNAQTHCPRSCRESQADAGCNTQTHCPKSCRTSRADSTCAPMSHREKRRATRADAVCDASVRRRMDGDALTQYRLSLTHRRPAGERSPAPGHRMDEAARAAYRLHQTPGVSHRMDDKERLLHRIGQSPRALHSRLPLAVERMISALCEDYDRRRQALGEGMLDRGLLDEYRRLNDLIDDALEETCEPPLRPLMRSDLADRRGAFYTQAYWISEGTYKERKQMAKHAIAHRMHLL